MFLKLTKHRHRFSQDKMLFYPKPTKTYPKDRDMSVISFGVGEVKEVDDALAPQIIEKFDGLIEVVDPSEVKKAQSRKRAALQADKASAPEVEKQG